MVLFIYGVVKCKNIMKEGESMAKNKPYGDNSRIGAIKNRTQIYNSKIDLYIKRDTITGRFLDVKTSGGKFKGVRIEK